MWMRKRKSPGRNGLTAFIDEGSEIEGKYTFSGTVMLNGRFKGEISTTDTLIIGDKAAVNGDVRAGRVLGDVEAPVVVLEEGVLFEGHCRMTKVNPNAEATTTRDFSVVPLKR